MRFSLVWRASLSAGRGYDAESQSWDRAGDRGVPEILKTPRLQGNGPRGD